MRSLLRFFLLIVIAGGATALLWAADSGHIKQVRETGICQRCDLRDGDLGGLKASDLRDSDLRGARLYKALLQGADMTGALLAFADLKGADLTGAQGVNFSGAETDERTTCPNGTAGPCQ